MNFKIFAPRPRKIDRNRLEYLFLRNAIPRPRIVSRSLLTYVTPLSSKTASSSSTGTPVSPAVSSSTATPELQTSPPPQTTETSAAITSTGIIAPAPTTVSRDDVIYSSENGKIRVPHPRRVDSSDIDYLAPKLSVLEKNVHSPVTPGEQFFQKFSVTPDLEQEAARRIAQYPAEERRSAVLPLLHEVQHRFGFISPESIEWVAAQLNIEPMKVVEVVTFYPGFRQKAPGKLHVRVCRTLSCAMGGSYELMDKLCEITGIDRSSADGHKDPISVSPCGNFSVEYAECLASCGTAPVCLVNDDFHEGIAPEKAQALLDSYKNA